MPRYSIALAEWQNSEKVTSNKFAFKEGEFLFGKLKLYFHKVGIALVNGICSTDIVVIAPIETTWSAYVLAINFFIRICELYRSDVNGRQDATDKLGNNA